MAEPVSGSIPQPPRGWFDNKYGSPVYPGTNAGAAAPPGGGPPSAPPPVDTFPPYSGPPGAGGGDGSALHLIPEAQRRRAHFDDSALYLIPLFLGVPASVALWAQGAGQFTQGYVGAKLDHRFHQQDPKGPRRIILANALGAAAAALVLAPVAHRVVNTLAWPPEKGPAPAADPGEQWRPFEDQSRYADGEHFAATG